jgi:hypothetical protein
MMMTSQSLASPSKKRMTAAVSLLDPLPLDTDPCGEIFRVGRQSLKPQVYVLSGSRHLGSYRIKTSLAMNLDRLIESFLAQPLSPSAQSLKPCK